MESTELAELYNLDFLNYNNLMTFSKLAHEQILEKLKSQTWRDKDGTEIQYEKYRKVFGFEIKRDYTDLQLDCILYDQNHLKKAIKAWRDNQNVKSMPVQSICESIDAMDSDKKKELFRFFVDKKTKQL